MAGRQNVPIGEDAAAAVESVVGVGQHEGRHPRELVRLRLVAADDALLDRHAGLAARWQGFFFGDYFASNADCSPGYDDTYCSSAVPCIRRHSGRRGGGCCGEVRNRE